MASKDSKSKAKPVLIREQPLLLEEMVNEERERMAARERTSTTSGDHDDPPKVNLPPPPVAPFPIRQETRGYRLPHLLLSPSCCQLAAL